MSISQDAEVPAKRLKIDDSVCGTDETPTEDSSREAVDKEWIEKLQRLLQCPVCYETIRPPVDICSNGHSVCGNCRVKLEQCPVCMTVFVSVKNIMLAQIAEYIKYPCRNAKGGCKEVGYLRDEEEHLKSCSFLLHKCKIGCCHWVGTREELQLHVEAQHQEAIWKKDWFFSRSRKFNEETSANRFEKFLIVQNELFWLLSKYDSEKKKLYKIFQYIGSKKMAQKYIYQICMRSVDDQRQFLFKSNVDDDSRSGNEIFDSPNCTVLDYNILYSFRTLSPHFKLKYHYFIFKLNEV